MRDEVKYCGGCKEGEDLKKDKMKGFRKQMLIRWDSDPWSLDFIERRKA
jgi:hypothetical protein